jgi:hypothetical protein
VYQDTTSLQGEEADIEVTATCDWIGIELGDTDEDVDSNEEADLRDLAGILIVNFGNIGVVPTGIATDALEVALLSLCLSLFVVVVFFCCTFFIRLFPLFTPCIITSAHALSPSCSVR